MAIVVSSSHLYHDVKQLTGVEVTVNFSFIPKVFEGTYEVLPIDGCSITPRLPYKQLIIMISAIPWGEQVIS